MEAPILATPNNMPVVPYPFATTGYMQVVPKQEYVVGFLLSKDLHAVLLIRKNRPDWQRGLLNGVGGKVEPGETPHRAMVREFQEEAGMLVSGWENVGTLEAPGYIVHVYRTTGDLNKARSLTSEPVGIYSVHGVASDFRCVPSLRWLVPFVAEPSRRYVHILNTEDVH